MSKCIQRNHNSIHARYNILNVRFGYVHVLSLDVQPCSGGSTPRTAPHVVCCYRCVSVECTLIFVGQGVYYSVHIPTLGYLAV
jgi:hypothetical protein